jgi:hypothetical protein
VTARWSIVVEPSAVQNWGAEKVYSGGKMKFLISSVSELISYPSPARVSHLKDVNGDPLWEVEISTLDELIDYIRACGDNVVIRLAVQVDKEIHNVLHIASDRLRP